MLTLQKTAPEEGVELLEREPPKAPGPGEVLVDVAAVGLCGSDLHAIAWAPGYAFMQDLLPLTLGHEFAGTVSKLGPGVSDFVTGARVVCWPTVSCGRCVACQQERPQDCQSRRIIGLHRDGGRWRLALSDGQTLPISRTRLAAVREALEQVELATA